MGNSLISCRAVPGSVGDTGAGTVKDALAVIVSMLLAMGGGLYNRYPLVYYDTGTYLKSSVLLRVPEDRPVFYGLWIHLVRSLQAPLFHASLWSVPVAQAGLLVYLIHRLIRSLGHDRRRSRILLVGSIGLLALGTGMPWFVGQLMPDIFTGYLAISFYLLVFGPRGFDRAGIAAIFLGSNLVHFSHLALSFSLILALLGVSAVIRPARGLRRRLLAPALLLAGGIAIVPAVNYALSGRATFASAGHVFLMDRLISDRIIYRLLTDHCGEKAYALCPYRETFRTLSGNDYLWAPDSVIQRIGGFRGSRAATWEMILDSLHYYPFAHLRSALLRSWEQFRTFGSGDGLRSYPPDKFVTRFIASDLPAEVPAFQASRQQAGGLEAQVRRLNLWEEPLAALCLLLGALAWARFLWRWKRDGEYAPPGPAMCWLGVALLVCALNAAVCGTLSGVNARYQNRVVWLVVLACFLESQEARKACRMT